jgi:hypothetical protein
MNTISIDILNPKASKLLKNLADLKLIAIRDNPKNGFRATLNNIRNKNIEKLSLEEISKEVENVRSKRYAK